MAIIKVKPKFAVGDKVRILNPNDYDTIKPYVGLEGKVTAHKGMYHVSMGKDKHNVFFEDELELITANKPKKNEK